MLLLDVLVFCFIATTLPNARLPGIAYVTVIVSVIVGVSDGRKVGFSWRLRQRRHRGMGLGNRLRNKEEKGVASLTGLSYHRLCKRCLLAVLHDLDGYRGAM